MSAKQIDVRCPCCDTVLTVDVLTSKVLRSSAATEVDEFGKPKLNEGGWDAALDKIKGRGATGGSAFDAALERERNREVRPGRTCSEKPARKRIPTTSPDGPGDPGGHDV